MLQLNHLENQILFLLKEKRKEDIKLIPKDLYDKLLLFCETQEDYESCIILRDLHDKIINKTMKELVENCKPLFL